jgi:hypothetical protein
MSDLQMCDRSEMLANLKTINRYGEDGSLKIDTRICKGCAQETGLIEDPEETIQQEPEESYTSPAVVDEALEPKI